MIAKEIGNRVLERAVYFNLGSGYNSLSEFPRAAENHKKHLNIAKKIGDRAGEANGYCLLGNIHHSLRDFPRAIEHHKKSLSIAKEISAREKEGLAYCFLGSAYAALKNFKKSIECYKQHLSIAEEIGNRAGEGCAHCNLGTRLLESGFLNEGLDHLKIGLKIFDTIRARFISEDGMKISFHTYHQCMYTYLWKTLVELQRNDEALYAAEKGRAQALVDALKVTYGLTSLSPRSIESEEEVKYLSVNTTVLTSFSCPAREKSQYVGIAKREQPYF